MAHAKNDIPALTGIRGVAALTVVVLHILIWRGLSDAWHLPTQWPVEIFFALSGFVMSMSYLRPDQGVKWRSFFIARFARVYPLHILTALLLGGYYFVLYQRKGTVLGDLSAHHWVQEITLSTAMPLIGSGGMWNDPSWSISVEAWVYVLVFPIIALIAARKPSPVLAAVVTTAMLAVFGAYCSSIPGGDHFKAGIIAFGRGAFGFAGGWAAYQLWKTIIVPGWLTDLVCLSMLGAMVLVKWLGVPNLVWLLLPLYPLVVLGLTNPNAGVSKLMATKPIVFLGEISYSIYLVHGVIRVGIYPFLNHFGLSKSVWAWFGIYLPIVLVVSTLTYLYFERPARDIIRARLSAKDKRQDTEVV